MASSVSTTMAERSREVTELVESGARPVVIFSKSSCCMSHTMKALFVSLGVNPMVHEVDQMPGGREIQQALLGLGCSPAVPAVFIGGHLLGGANQVISLHVTNSLIPMLQRAGAL